jgi:hypothetical protein
MLMGGKCQACGEANHAVLGFVHSEPVRRGTNKLPKNHNQGVRLYRRILRGQRIGIELLCANCAITRRALVAEINAAMVQAKGMIPSASSQQSANANSVALVSSAQPSAQTAP